MTVVCELVTDGRGVITRASAEAAGLLAIEARWLAHKPLANFVAAGDRSRFRSFLLDLEDGRTAAATQPFVLQARDGTQIAAEVAATRADGSVAWTIEAESDVPPLEGAGKAGVSDRMFERLLNRLPQGVVAVDRELRLVYANPAGRRLLGTQTVGVGASLPDPWPDFSLPDLAASLFGRQPAAGNHLVETGDRVICITGLPAARASSAVLLLEDVTQREWTRRSERRFVENAAHELRTPLAAIVSVIEVLEGGAKDDPAARDRFLMHIRVHSERLARLATSLLTLARIQTGQEQPRLDLVPLEPLLSEVAEALDPQPGVAIHVRAPSHICALADRDLLYQALENVAGNAVKHTREGEVVFSANDLGRTVEIEIRDSGRGMEPEDARHAFDRFYRVRHRESDGFGLGLAIAEETLTAMGGKIALESRPGVGTTVRIALASARLIS